MANNTGAIKKNMAIPKQNLECPVCNENFTIPIFQCKMGHSICCNCTMNLRPPVCPFCRQDMTQTRNLHLENIVAEVKVECPNKSMGCVYELKNNDVQDHIKECIFRKMDCPLGAIFGKCSWNGYMKEMMEHFKAKHPDHCNITTDTEVQLDNIDITQDDRHVYLAQVTNKFLFLMSMKIDTLQKMAYWTVQHIGSKNAAKTWIYEIHVTSKQDNRRKVIYIEHCFNDALKTEEVYRTGKCAMIPLPVLATFIKDKKLSYRFFIKKTGPQQPKDKQNENKPDNYNKHDNNSKHDNNKAFKPKGPGPNKGQGPQKKQGKN